MCLAFCFSAKTPKSGKKAEKEKDKEKEKEKDKEKEKERAVTPVRETKRQIGNGVTGVMPQLVWFSSE